MDFQEADRRYTEITRRQQTGSLTWEEFDEELKQLMVQDEEGRWWAKSRTAGEWYYHDGTAWVKDTPPGYQTPQAHPPEQPETQQSGSLQGQTQAQAQMQRVAWSVLILIAVLFVIVIVFAFTHDFPSLWNL